MNIYSCEVERGNGQAVASERLRIRKQGFTDVDGIFLLLSSAAGEAYPNLNLTFA